MYDDDDEWINEWKHRSLFFIVQFHFHWLLGKLHGIHWYRNFMHFVHNIIINDQRSKWIQEENGNIQLYQANELLSKLQYILYPILNTNMKYYSLEPLLF